MLIGRALRMARIPHDIRQCRCPHRARIQHLVLSGICKGDCNAQRFFDCSDLPVDPVLLHLRRGPGRTEAQDQTSQSHRFGRLCGSDRFRQNRLFFTTPAGYFGSYRCPDRAPAAGDLGTSATIREARLFSSSLSGRGYPRTGRIRTFDHRGGLIGTGHRWRRPLLQRHCSCRYRPTTKLGLLR